MSVMDVYSKGGVQVATSRRLGAIMGLPEEASRSDVALANTVAQGLTVEALDNLVAHLGRAALIGRVVPETTYRRTVKAKTPFARDMSDRIYEMSRVTDAAARVYRGDAERMHRFLNKPHRLLEGRTPLEMAGASAAGADAVVALIERAEAGFPV